MTRIKRWLSRWAITNLINDDRALDVMIAGWIDVPVRTIVRKDPVSRQTLRTSAKRALRNLARLP